MSSDNTLGTSLANVFARTARRETGPRSPRNSQSELPLDEIRPPAANPRKHMDETALEELTESIRVHGILQPIVVQRLETGYEVVAGERRYRAARRAGLTSVPVVIREQEDPVHLAELRLIENVQREDLNPVELAHAYQALIDEHGLTQEAVAQRVGKDRSSIANCLRLLTLEVGLQRQLVVGQLSMGHAKALLGLGDDHEAQRRLAQRIAEEGLSVRETERAVRLGGRATRGKAKPTAPHIAELEDNLFRLFGAPVKVREQGGKGTLTVSFPSKAAFQRIVEVLDRACREANKR